MHAKKAPPVEDPVAEELIKRGLAVAGQTYDVRHDLHRIGCQWYAYRRVWIAPNDHVLARATKIVADGESRKSTADFDLRGVPSQALVREVLRRNIDLSVSTLGDAVAGWPPTIEEVVAAVEESFDFSEFETGRPPGDEGEEA